MIKSAVIGLGKMGISHCSILGAHPDVELAGVCDASKLSLTAIEKYTPFKCYTDYKQMIDECNLDCIFIATPTKLHSEMAHYAMDRHVNLFVEKPLCVTYEEGQKMAGKAHAINLVNQVGYHNRFIGTFREVKRLLDANVLGDVYHFLGEAYGPVVLKEKGGTWRSKKNEAGGCLYDYSSHVINLVNFYFGEPSHAAGTVLKSVFSKDVDDAVYSTLVFDNGLSGQISVNWSDETHRKMSTQVTIVGSKGKIIVDSQEVKIYLMYDNPEMGLKSGWNIKWLTDLTEPVYFNLRGEEYSAQVDYFIQKVKNKNLDNINSFATALATDKVIDSMLKDSETTLQCPNDIIAFESARTNAPLKQSILEKILNFFRILHPKAQ